MTYVILRDAELPENAKTSPWRGCLHFDKLGRPWYATSLAKPTEVDDIDTAEELAETVRKIFPKSTITIKEMADVFPKKKPPLTNPPVDSSVKKDNEIDSWNWNKDEPF